MQDADEDSNASPRPGGSLDRVRPPSAAGRRRTAKAADHEDEVEDEGDKDSDDDEDSESLDEFSDDGDIEVEDFGFTTSSAKLLHP